MWLSTTDTTLDAEGGPLPIAIHVFIQRAPGSSPQVCRNGWLRHLMPVHGCRDILGLFIGFLWILRSTLDFCARLSDSVDTLCIAMEVY